MFDFLKPAHTIVENDEETGTYADALLQVPELQLTNAAHEYGHDAHTRDYGDQREIARSSLGFV
ncbi:MULTISPECIES: hypothetical protein [Rhizobium/Agrobacterium group]|jgi:hypothetical protein|uniref:Uncharacterized protein n=1 Tax=Rhizobium rhizogenes TaxID=359 RepID=A0AA92H9S9_RHIRH|nr:hypothetical protein [Rhizobium rhizogenes]PVE55215.1 hypothetical protein DC430_08345 [Rhizobium rhizogenes]PVE67769.1 hypothetical protein DC415_06990 [Agrobacterium tumefaciens]PVE77546.1 hypothetical protein DCP16_06990 [Sphingomonas sp. TPD3009]